MCGINGALRLRTDSPAIDREEVLRTRTHQHSRGPDAAGLWVADDGRVALANNRLAILDLSAAGAQPMASADGRYRITFNGEIYNFRALRAGLEAQGVRFRSESDTEVLLALHARDGLAMLPQLRGMFAFALWDDVAKSLLLARDPFGIKPLYYSTEGDMLRFASQVKSMLAGGAVSSEVDLAAVAGFLLWGSVPGPLTVRRSIRQLRAGHYLLVEDGRVGESRAYPMSPSADDTVASRPLSLADALADSVAAHLVADVPVAVFLSSGLDSALVAALARRHHPDLTTLTVRFRSMRDTPADEGPIAARVAATLGTRHRELELSGEELRALWPAALAAMDQPSIDGFNTFVISRAAREAGFKVVLSGLGGDELFGGYPSFRDVPRVMRVARLARRVPGLPALWPRLAATNRRPKTAGLLRYGRTLPGAYLLRRGLFLPEELPGLLGEEAAVEALRRYDPIADTAAALEEPIAGNAQALAADPWLGVHQLETARYLRHQLLRDSDWASMAWSVELRVPLVDRTLHRHALRAGFAPARAGGKAAAVRAAAPELPMSLFARKKTGFYVPLTEALADDATALSHGGRSRRLALHVLAAQGVALPWESAALRARRESRDEIPTLVS
jgi:asparagine synthase (glutamine-hydrolysing)